MTTADPTLDARIDAATPDARIDAATPDARAARPSSLLGVLTSSDHKVIGRLYISSSLLGVLIAGVLGVLLGIERIDGGGTLLDQGALSQLFSGYRVGLIFAVLIPLFLGVSVLIVPLQLGARSLAFPRAAALGFWTWFGGAVLVIIALANNGGPFGGDHDMVELYIGAFVLMVVGLAASAATVAVSVLTTRAPGMRMMRVPLFSWSALVWAIGLVLVLPVLAGVLVYLFVDYQYTGTMFGGAAGIYGWTSFLITGPVLALFAAPAVGVLAELIPVTLGKRLARRGVVFAGLALLGLGLLAGVGQQDVAPATWWDGPLSRHNYGTKLGDLITYALFVVLPALGVLVVLAVGALTAKPAAGSKTAAPKLTAAFVFAFFGADLVLLGLLGNVLNPFADLGLQGTVFEEGATVAIVYGALLAGLGAIAYWFPKIAGPRLPDPPLFGLALLGALGAALASVPYGIAGFADQPGYSAVWSNAGPGELLNVLVTIGHGLVVVVALAFVGLALKTWRSSEAVGESDPWGGHTLEWTTTSPAPADNFGETPTVMSPEPILDLTAAPPGAGG